MSFERLKLRYKYLINMEEVSGSVTRVCSVYNRVCDAISVIREFSSTVILSSDEGMHQEMREMLEILYEKREKLEDILSDIKLSVKFD